MKDNNSSPIEVKVEENIYILVGCEESQAVTIAFRELGFKAYSCDLLPCSGGHPEWHIQGDVFNAIEGGILPLQSGDNVIISKWHAAIFHPECTRLTVTANKWYKPEYAHRFPTIHEDREAAVDFFMKLVNCNIEYTAIENPIGIMSTRYRKPNQVIQPYYFGDTERKSTCLWLKGLPKLVATNVVEPEIIYHKSGRTDGKLHFETMKLPKEERRKARSVTFPGIAKAMAEQWGGFLVNNITPPTHPVKEGDNDIEIDAIWEKVDGKKFMKPFAYNRYKEGEGETVTDLPFEEGYLHNMEFLPSTDLDLSIMGSEAYHSAIADYNKAQSKVVFNNLYVAYDSDGDEFSHTSWPYEVVFLDHKKDVECFYEDDGIYITYKDAHITFPDLKQLTIGRFIKGLDLIAVPYELTDYGKSIFGSNWQSQQTAAAIEELKLTITKLRNTIHELEVENDNLLQQIP